MLRRSTGLVIAILTVAACSGGDVAPDTTLATTLATTTTTRVVTTTSVTTTVATTTTLATTTTTRAPVPVVGWDGPGLDTIVLTIDADRSPTEFTQVLRAGVDAMGIVPGDDGMGVEVVVRATPLGASYGSAGTCYTGARVEVAVRITDPATGSVVAAATEVAEQPTSRVVLGCATDPGEAPFRYPFESALGAVAVALFAEGAVPLLATTVGADHYALAPRIDAVQAIRLMDWDGITADAQFAFLDRALWFAARITHMAGDGDVRRYRIALQRLFEEALDWDLDLPETGNASADALAIRMEMSTLAVRYGR